MNGFDGRIAAMAVLVSGMLAACGSAGTGVGGGGGIGGGNGGGAGSPLPAQLQGEWQSGTVSTIDILDPGTGRWADASSTIGLIKLTADGRYEETGVIVVTTYSCTSKLFVHHAGAVRLEGNRLTFQPATSYAKGYTCDPSKVYEKRNHVEPKTYEWSVEANDTGRDVLSLKDPNSSGRPGLYDRRSGGGGNPGTPNPGNGGASGTIAGTVKVPEGSNVWNVSVLACPVDGGCGSARMKSYRVDADGQSAPFSITGLGNEPYTLVAWKDVDGSRTLNAGDLAGGHSTNGQDLARVTPPAQNLVIETEVVE